MEKPRLSPEQPQSRSPEVLHKKAEALSFVSEDIEAVFDDWRGQEEVVELWKRLEKARKEEDMDWERAIQKQLEPQWQDFFDQIVHAREDYCENFEGEEREWISAVYDMALLAKRTSERESLSASGKKSPEATKKFREMALIDASWQGEVVQLISDNSDDPELGAKLEKLWSTPYAYMRQRFGPQGEANVRAIKSGIFGAVGASRLLDSAGIEVYQSTPEQDVHEKIDLIGKVRTPNGKDMVIFFQVKTSAETTEPRLHLAQDMATTERDGIDRAVRTLQIAALKFQKNKDIETVACWIEMPAVVQKRENGDHVPHPELDGATGIPDKKFLDKYTVNVHNFIEDLSAGHAPGEKKRRKIA